MSEIHKAAASVDVPQSLKLWQMKLAQVVLLLAVVAEELVAQLDISPLIQHAKNKNKKFDKEETEAAFEK